MINYGFTKEMDIPCEPVVEQAREMLKKEGFVICARRRSEPPVNS